MRIRNRNKPNGNLKLERVANLDDCPHGLLNTFGYGNHPARYYAACFRCHKFTVLEWHDPYARTFNRVIGTLPAIITVTSIIVVLVITVIAILPIVNH